MYLTPLQSSKKKLESRRSAYDSTLSKIQKAKKDDYKAEEDLRSQKAKYEESTEDVYRRMQDIIDAEQDNLNGLYAFLEAELNFHDRSREVLIQLKRNWPANAMSGGRPTPPTRSRSSTLQSQRAFRVEEDDLPPPPLPFRSSPSGAASPSREGPGFDWSGSRPSISRGATSDTLTAPRPNISRNITADSASLLRQPTPLRSIRQRQGSASDVFSDPMDEAISSSPPKFWENERSSSPATSQGGLSYSSGLSRNTSWESGGKSFGTSINANTMGVQGKKAPPPPPPSRGAKPAPPPPPAKRSNLGTTVSTYSG